jgi:Ni/Co efflux regulator RcnB
MCGTVQSELSTCSTLKTQAIINMKCREANMQNGKIMSISGMAALVLAGALAATPVFADKPEGTGGGKGQKNKQQKENSQQGQGDRGGSYFGQRQQVVVREYYEQEYRGGKCPPGLAKKNNGCMPPGQAKKWSKGRPLPRDVVYYDVPQQLVVRLGAPPSGHKYVRVASDILLIAVGTAMVVDAISDLGRM